MRTRRLLSPEVVQTSAMDCGPACLKSLLEGFAIPVSYDRLREACQTDLDGTAPLAIAGALLAVLLPLAAEPLVAERDLRFRTHSGGLCRFYYDALRGLMPVRAHGAEYAVQAEHEELLVHWSRAGFSLQRTAVVLEGANAVFGLGLSAALLLSHVARNADSGVGLLLIYWALSIPVLGRQIVQAALLYPRLRNLSLRLLEPLSAVEEPPGDESAAAAPALDHGVAIEFQDVSVRASGQTILSDVGLAIEPGRHVSIVGPSGAGKSTLVGLLLGWHRPAAGRILIDGQPLDERRLERLRRETVWVDPGVHLWNRSLLENLRYGRLPESGPPAIGHALEQAGLLPVLEKLPDGLQSRLGEAGALVSGGEGQRVRLGRGMLRGSPRLVILDEPFTALDSESRDELLRRARRIWANATLLFVTHDLGAARDFERVVVVERGRVAGDAPPEALVRQSDSPYRRLLEAEEALRRKTWAGQAWRRMRLVRGRIHSTEEKREHADRLRRDRLAGQELGRSVAGAGAEGVPSRRAS